MILSLTGAVFSAQSIHFAWVAAKVLEKNDLKSAGLTGVTPVGRGDDGTIGLWTASADITSSFVEIRAKSLRL